MIKRILYIGLLIISSYGFSQSKLRSIDKRSKNIPSSIQDYKEISEYLSNNLKTDREKVRAIYIWIAHNIKYDLHRENSVNYYYSNQQLINDVLKTRKGVCQHYSELFLAMSRWVGLKSYLIPGYTRNSSGEITDLSHIWNAIEIDSKYYLVDVTWAAGFERRGKYIHKFRDDYFLVTPEDFIQDHMPFDPIWQFTNNPIKNIDFISKNFSKFSEDGNFAFKDSIQQFNGYSNLKKLENSNRRIIANGIENDQIQRKVNGNFLQITNERYNLAMDTLNYGIDSYNKYIISKNGEFKNPKLEDSNIRELIENVESGFFAANNILKDLSSSNERLKSLITSAQKSIPDLMLKLKKEKIFLDGYF